MPLILYEYALQRFRHKPPKWILMISATFKSTSAPKQWLVCMIFFAIILLHLRIHSLRNYSLISLHVSTVISSITSPTNIPRMMNQSNLSTPQFLHFIPMIQFTFFEDFYIFLILYATPRFLPPPPGTKHKTGPPAENDRQPRRKPEGLLHLYKAAELS